MAGSELGGEGWAEVTNPEREPVEQWCHGSRVGLLPSAASVEVLRPRDVPLGGPRAMTVRRTLPQRQRSLVGAWCFADHYGPDDFGVTGGMDVAPHPHTGLQTVSWLFAGELEHRDSMGNHALVRPGEVNLMTGGLGICHSEVSTPRARLLHGVQLWVALPADHRYAPRDFQHYAPEPVHLDGAVVRVFLGSLAGSTSPVTSFTPLLGAELVLRPNSSLNLQIDPTFELGVLVDRGTPVLAGTELQAGELGCMAPGAAWLALANPTAEPVRLLLLGGPAFGEDIVMWWNFVARSHEEIVAFRDAWQAGSDQFGQVVGYTGPIRRLPAPALPNARIKPRSNP